MDHHENASDHQIPHRHAPHHHLADPQRLDHQLRQFLAKQSEEALLVTGIKNHALPLESINDIMKSEEGGEMIKSEALILLGKACEMFILDLTLRSWSHGEENKSMTLQKDDIITAMAKTNAFDFLVDLIPKNDFKEEDAKSKLEGGDFVQFSSEGALYYYMPPSPPPPGPPNVHQTAQSMRPKTPPPSPPASYREG